MSYGTVQETRELARDRVPRTERISSILPSRQARSSDRRVTLDQRFIAKTVPRAPQSSGASHRASLDSLSIAGIPDPIIKNEELLLLRAEANHRTRRPGLGVTDINTVRTLSGGLPPSEALALRTPRLPSCCTTRRTRFFTRAGIAGSTPATTAGSAPADRPAGGNPPDVVFSTLRFQRGDAAEGVSAMDQEKAGPSGVGGSAFHYVAIRPGFWAVSLFCYMCAFLFKSSPIGEPHRGARARSVARLSLKDGGPSTHQ